MYIHYADLSYVKEASKSSATGLMRALISVWYTRERLASCSATHGINTTIQTAIFSEQIIRIHCNYYIQSIDYCREVHGENSLTFDKFKSDLTSKCGEERRKLKKN